MPRTRQVSDADIQQYLDLGMTQGKVARLLGVSEAAISKRLAAMRLRDAALADGKSVNAARSSVFNFAATQERCAQMAEALLSEALEPMERLQVIQFLSGLSRSCLSSLGTLYSIDEQRAFQEEVLAALAEMSPDAREKVLRRLRETRPLRAALLGGGRSVSEPEGDGAAAPL
jgi:predicted transcriptional regulator